MADEKDFRAKEDSSEPPGPEGAEKASKSDAPEGAEQKHSEPEQKTTKDLPQVDFSTFVLSLSTSALMNLGEIQNPMTKKVEKELPVARQTIDLIDVLKEKTKGNLTEYESKLIENVLTDLRLRYLRAVEAEKGD